ncbi:MAG: hypothetical protein CMF46_03280 [Legionellales bacterium]|nr:hypothetical protein [Legionellales bacterium]
MLKQLLWCLIVTTISPLSAFTCDVLSQEIWGHDHDVDTPSLLLTCLCRMCYDEKNNDLSTVIHEASQVGIVWQQGEITQDESLQTNLKDIKNCPNHDGIDGAISPLDVSLIAQIFWHEIGTQDQGMHYYCELPTALEQPGSVLDQT